MVMNVAQKLGGAPASRLIGSAAEGGRRHRRPGQWDTGGYGLDYDDTLVNT